ncbi:hypothetical protein ACKGJI_04540 [Sulfurospirillum sp. 1307]
MSKPDGSLIEKIYKTKDVIVGLKYYGNSFDKLKTKHPGRAKAIILGYKVYKSGLCEEQLKAILKKDIKDKDIIKVLDYKDLKYIRSWSVSADLKEEDKELELLRIWCKKIGAMCLLSDVSQKDIITLAKTLKDNLECEFPKEF